MRHNTINLSLFIDHVGAELEWPPCGTPSVDRVKRMMLDFVSGVTPLYETIAVPALKYGCCEARL